ncbi:MAG TPA: hypothetical protein VGX78_11325 [Pirellulales bacterium]|nr:hypothetical protein [Pirellulales bacterium]
MTKRVYIETIHERETTDVVVQETRRIKEVLAESMDFDIGRILDAARQKQNGSGRKLLSPPVRKGNVARP